MDIYSFGMCALEIITREEPYKECNGSVGRIAYRCRRGILPKSLASVRNVAAKEFIQTCLKPDRPTARELLQHPFLVATEGIDEEVLTG